MTIMAKNAPEYGLDHVTADLPIEYDTIQMPSPTNLALVSDLIDTPTAELLQLNPALLRGIAPGGFDLRVPKGTADQVTAGLNLVPAEIRVASRVHRVEPGESIASIARRYNSSAHTILAANNLSASEPAPGDRLVIPAAWRDVSAPSATSARSAKSRATQTANRRKPVSRATQPVASRRPAHRTAGVIAQAGHRSRGLNP